MVPDGPALLQGALVVLVAGADLVVDETTREEKGNPAERAERRW